MEKTYLPPITPPSNKSVATEEYWSWSPSSNIQNKGDNLVPPSSFLNASDSPKDLCSSSSPDLNSLDTPGSDIHLSLPSVRSIDMKECNESPSHFYCSSDSTRAYNKIPPSVSCSTFSLEGYDRKHSAFSGGTFTKIGYNTNPLSLSSSLNPSYTPATLFPLKRKRGVDTLSLTVKNISYNIYISDRESDFELDDENFELPLAKRAKYHHRRKIITASGEAEYHSPVCQMHAELDISLPVHGCKNCTRVEKLLSVYATWYDIFRKSNRKEKDSCSFNSRRAWDKLRCKLANYKVKMDKSVQVPASPLRERSSEDAPLKRKLSVRIDPSTIPDPAVYRSETEFRRTTKNYIPGRHADTSGGGFLNTSKPGKQTLDEWKSPPLLPTHQFKNTLRPCLRRRNNSKFEPYPNNHFSDLHVPGPPPVL
ncbi:hypothetical protein MMC27_002764 [Xylographa pallens]|nr:hypothetical protein [Xylographa pallens]